MGLLLLIVLILLLAGSLPTWAPFPTMGLRSKRNVGNPSDCLADPGLARLRTGWVLATRPFSIGGTEFGAIRIVRSIRSPRIIRSLSRGASVCKEACLLSVAIPVRQRA